MKHTYIIQDSEALYSYCFYQVLKSFCAVYYRLKRHNNALYESSNNALEAFTCFNRFLTFINTIVFDTLGVNCVKVQTH